MNHNFLIYGNDEFLIKNNIKKIIKTQGNTDSNIIYYNLEEDTLDSVLEELNTFDLFDNQKIVICENTIFLSSECKKDTYNLEPLIEYLTKAKSDNIFIMSINGNIDERKKIVKEIKKLCNVIKCDKLKDYEIEDTISKKFRLKGYSIKNPKLILDRVGNDLQIINNEIEKLMMYKIDDKVITDEDIINLVCEKIDDNIFNLIDAVTKKDIKRSFELYNGLTTYYGEEPTKIIVMISAQFRLILQCKILSSENLSESEIASYLKIHPYRVKLALEKARNIEYKTLTKYLTDLSNLDIEIKSGKKDKNVGLELFLLNM